MNRIARQENDAVRFLAPWLDERLADFEEVIKDQGDGVVALKRSRLDGVDDFVVLEFNHLNMTNDPADPAVRRLHEEILARIAAESR